jgi:hypothetical protein
LTALGLAARQATVAMLHDLQPQIEKELDASYALDYLGAILSHLF